MNAEILNQRTVPILWVIFLVSFAVSLGYSLYYRIEPAVDARAYDGIAWNITQGHGYTEDPNLPLSEASAIRRPGPGYEYFLAGVYALFGHRYLPVWVIQAFLHACSAIFVYFIARKVFDEHWHPLVGIFAAILFGLSIDLIIGSSMLLTETLSIFLMLAAFLVFLKSCEKPAAYGLIACAGLLLGIAALVRAPLVLLALPMIWYVWHKGRGPLRPVIFCAALLLAFAPWSTYTYRVYGMPLPFGANLGLNLYSGNHPGATGELDPDYHTYPYNELGPVGGERMLRSKAIDFISSNPGEFLKITAYRTSMYFAFSRPTGWWPYLQGNARYATLAVSAIYSVILFTFGCAGAYSFIKNHARRVRERAVFLLASLLMIPLGVVFIIVETRYRYPIYPFFAIFAGYGIYQFWENRRIIAPLAVSFLILSANTLFDVARNWSRILERLPRIF